MKASEVFQLIENFLEEKDITALTEEVRSVILSRVMMASRGHENPNTVKEWIDEAWRRRLG